MGRVSSIDLRGPFVLDTRDLGRRAGTQREYELTVPAPPELGIDVFAVPEGDDVDVDVRLEAVVDGVLATGTVFADLKGECVRCLEPIDETVEVTFQELFVYDDGRDADVSEDDDEVSMLRDDLLDLEPLLRDAVVLALPFQPLCTDDCPGLCPECGARLADDPDHAHGEPSDPRWAQLGKWSDS